MCSYALRMLTVTAPFDRCTDHQTQALAGISLVKTLIETPYEHYDPAAMAAVRRDLGKTLSAYQLLKHDGIFNPAIASGDPARVDTAREMKVACIAAGEEFRQYVGVWTGIAGHDRWAEYRLSTLNLVKRLREHLDSERRALAVLAAMETAH